MKKHRMMMVVVSSAFLWILANLNPVFAQEGHVKAKIGILIQSGDKLMRAGSQEIVKSGSQIQICILPMENTYMYVIHSDEKNAVMLNKTIQEFRGEILYLPSVQNFYLIDGKSPIERFTIVCSPNKLIRLELMVDEDMPLDKWAEMEKDLNQSSAIELTRKPESSIEIAGNVRALVINDRSLFVNELPIFSGKGILVKKYEFQVKK